MTEDKRLQAEKIAATGRAAAAVVARTGHSPSRARSIVEAYKHLPPMTGDELRDARAVLGEVWGFDRPLHATEMGRVLRMGGKDVGESIRDYERGKTKISGPMSVAIALLLAGGEPPDGRPKG